MSLERGEVASLSGTATWIGATLRNGYMTDREGRMKHLKEVYNGKSFDRWWPSGVLRKLALSGMRVQEYEKDVEIRTWKAIFYAQSPPWPDQYAPEPKRMVPIFRVAKILITNPQGEQCNTYFVSVNPVVVNPIA